MTERADDMAAAFLQHLQRMTKHSNSAEKQAVVGIALLVGMPAPLTESRFRRAARQ